MVFKVGGSVGANQTDNDTTEDSLIESIKESMATSSGVVTNSGSTNTGKTSTVNSGSVNTQSANSNTSTSTDGSVNSTVNSGSVNTVNNSGSVNTSQLMLSEDAANHLTKQMLESSQGLTAVAKGQKTAGGYNSTANEMLTNDLLSRVAGEVAARGAMTVQNIGASSSSQVIGGSSSITNIGGTKSNSSTSTSGMTNVGGSTSESNVLNVIGGSTATTNTTTSALDHILGTSSSNKQQDVRETKEEVHSESGWIVCTELLRQKRMNPRHYYYGLKVFQNYDNFGKRGYYYWAVPAVNHLRNHPKSRISKALEAVMCARAEQLAADSNCTGAKKSVLGWIAKHGLYVACWTLARTLARSYDVNSAEFVTIRGVQANG